MKPTDEQLADSQWWDENRPDWEVVYCKMAEAYGATQSDMCEHCIPRPAKPEPREWDGVEWPVPVGITIQNGFGEHRTVIAHDGDRIVCRCEKSSCYRGYDRAEAHKLSPLKTQAEREREELAELIDINYGNSGAGIADAILAKYELKERK